jgi:hypothetical protein
MSVQLSFEVPIKYSEQLDDTQDYLFVLGQNLDDATYFDYVRRSDKYKILDNGANESTYIPPYRLAYLCDQIHANMVVIPDVQFSFVQSMSLFTTFYNLIKRKNPEIALMGVPQGNNFHLHRKMVLAMNKVVNAIGIPYKLILHFGYGIIPTTQTPLHMLGFPDKDVGYYMNSNGNFKSMDTGAPFNAALKGIRFEELIAPVRGVNIADSNIKLTSDIEDLFRHNVKILRKIVSEQPQTVKI